MKIVELMREAGASEVDEMVATNKVSRFSWN